MNPRYAFLAAAMAHMEGYYSTKSPAYRNNNPGNIEHANGMFQVYPSKLVGFEALVADIAANKGKTLAQFIAKYAPPNENNTGLYITVVTSLTGMTPEEIL